MFDHLSRWFKGRSRRRRQETGAVRTKRVRPTLDLLETRLAPAVFNVNSTADILNPTGGVVTPRSAIKAANAAAGNNVINLTQPGTYKITLPGAGEDNNATGDFDIIPNAASPPNSTLLIQNTSGGTVIVDGNHLDRVFDINPGNTNNPATKLLVTMQGFTIQDGDAFDAGNPDGPNGSGGGIRDQGNANLTLTNMVIVNNVASADGGGVVMENAPGSTIWTLTINNSTMSNNHAGDAGGGVDADGKGRVFITGGVISGNTDVNQGAGVYLDGIANAVDTVTIANGGSGYTSAPTVTFSAAPPGGTTATGIATISGGVVTAVTITNSGTGYTAGAPTVTFSAPPPGGTTATATATVVANQTANLTMTGALVSGNTSTGTANGLGGGISNAGNGAVTIINSTIENNFAATTGGGFSDENNGLGTLNVSNSLFLNNSAVGNGGAIFMSGPSATITNTEIKGNTTNANGGGLFDSGTTLTIQSSTFFNNTASTNGGGIELETTGTGTTGSTITNTTVTGNSALNNTGAQTGGGIDAPAAFTGSVRLVNDTINGNFATNGGGVFWAGAGGSTFALQNIIVAQNFAGTTGPDANNPAGTFTDNGGNLIGIAGAGSGNTGFTAATTQTGTTATPLDPKLGPLQNNGGPAIGVGSTVLETEALLPGSKALDKGVTSVANPAPTVDERGLPRPDETASGAQPDIGAIETQDKTGNAAFVAALYRDLLHRHGDLASPNDAGGWVMALSSGTMTPATVANLIARSPEALGIVVDGLYARLLNRASDPGGRASFLSFLENGGTVEQAITVIVTSPEYTNLTGGTDSGFVQSLYTNLLGRTGSTSEVNGWVSQLPGLGRSGVASAFLQATEFRTDAVQQLYGFTAAPTQSVASLFPNLLRRTAAPVTAEVNGWVNSGLDILTMEARFAGSGEYFTLAATFTGGVFA